MKLSEVREKRSIESPVVGEIYTVKSFTLEMVDDKFHKGEKRPLVKLDTDKGMVFAPNTFARSVKESIDEGEDVNGILIGAKLKCKQYFNQTYGKNTIIMEFMDD